jgi:hypothetical protein
VRVDIAGVEQAEQLGGLRVGRGRLHLGQGRGEAVTGLKTGSWPKAGASGVPLIVT